MVCVCVCERWTGGGGGGRHLSRQPDHASLMEEEED